MKSSPHDDPLLQAIAGVPSGLSVSAIERSLSLRRRTAQRKLRSLLEAGFITKSGNGRATRYALAGNHPVGEYQHTLIRQYRPNVDAYLPAAWRQSLLGLNRKTQHSRAAPMAAHAGAKHPALLWPYWSRAFVWNSARLAGGHYDYCETDEFLETDTPSPLHPPHDAQSLINHLRAIRLVVQDDIRLDELTFRNLHAILVDNLMADQVEGGMLRHQPYPEAPEHTAQVLRLMLERSNDITEPFEQSFFLFLHVSGLRLFPHANARLARVVANLPLLRAGLYPITWSDITLSRYQHALPREGNGLVLDRVKQLYKEACEASCRHFASLPALAMVNPLRLRYRKELGCLVREIVLTPMSEKTAQEYLAATFGSGDNLLPQPLRELTLKELDALHAGNIFRYGIELEDFLAWKKACVGK